MCSFVHKFQKVKSNQKIQFQTYIMSLIFNEYRYVILQFLNIHNNSCTNNYNVHILKIPNFI